ncbi:MAG: SMI1/KNR4 family protein [Verrucomicrobiaceae bacterium]|nr:MAG: SMI1/KNR4 family protein [Verrucomicrobiaceae bacterium]
MNFLLTMNEDCASATESDVAGFETENRLELPSDYREFLMTQPGGSPEADFSAFDRSGDFVAYIHGWRSDSPWKRLTSAISDFGHDLSLFLPFAVSNGGNFFILKLSPPDFGAVYFWDHELEDSCPPTFDCLIRVADSFVGWLGNLSNGPPSKTG